MDITMEFKANTAAINIMLEYITPVLTGDDMAKLVAR